MVKTMEWQGQSLLLLDQTKLPSEIITILCKDYRRVGEAIKRLEVRGAPAIGAAAAFGMVLGWQELASGCLAPQFKRLHLGVPIVAQLKPPNV